MNSDAPAEDSPHESGPDGADRIVHYQPWLTVLARMEIDSRFAGKFSASDAVQQTMTEAWRCWNDFRGTCERQRLAWLRQILAHQLARLARHYAGAAKRDVTREISLERSLAESSLRLEYVLAADGDTPSQTVERDEQQILLAQVLERLPEDYRQVIQLRNLCDLPHSEVARRMDRTEGAVRMLWMRALAELKKELERPP